MLFSSEIWSEGFVILNLYFYINTLRCQKCSFRKLLSHLWLFVSTRSLHKHSWFLGNSSMNIYLKRSDIERFKWNLISKHTIQRWRNEISETCLLRDRLSVSTLHCSQCLKRYRLLLRRYFGFASTKSNSFAKNQLSFQTFDIKSRKSRLPCQLSASTGIGESSPRYHLSSLSSHVDKVIVISKERRMSLSASMLNVATRPGVDRDKPNGNARKPSRRKLVISGSCHGDDWLFNFLLPA